MISCIFFTFLWHHLLLPAYYFCRSICSVMLVSPVFSDPYLIQLPRGWVGTSVRVRRESTVLGGVWGRFSSGLFNVPWVSFSCSPHCISSSCGASLAPLKYKLQKWKSHLCYRKSTNIIRKEAKNYSKKKKQWSWFQYSLTVYEAKWLQIQSQKYKTDKNIQNSCTASEIPTVAVWNSVNFDPFSVKNENGGILIQGV